MKKAIFMSMLACVASLMFTSCGDDDDEPQPKNDQAKVTVKYNFEQSKDLHDAVDVEITYYDLETGEIVTEVMPATTDGDLTLSLENKDSFVCAFYLSFKSKEGFAAEAGSTYDWSLNYSVDVIVEQPGKDALMWSEEALPLFSHEGVNAEYISDVIDLLNEGDEASAGCVVQKVDGAFYIYDKTGSVAELFK